MSPPPRDPRSGSGAVSERTMMIPTPKRPAVAAPDRTAPLPGNPPSAPSAPRAPKNWKPYRFAGLEKVSRQQVQLSTRLQWLMPGVTAHGQVSETARARLHEMLEEEVQLTTDYVHVVAPNKLRRYVSDPAFLAVLAPQPNKTRGFLEVELGLAHVVIDMLLGGAGEAVSLRPLTDIEEGVMTYVIIETLKALSPALDPTLPRLRLEGVCRGFDEAVQLIGDEQNLVVVQMKAMFGTHSGYLRVFVPASVVASANPPSDAAVRRARRASEAQAHIKRLSAVKTWLRAEIGQVEISSSDLAQIRERDVVLVDQLLARPDRGEGGTCRLKVGMGRTGHLDADVTLVNGRFKATITGISLGEEEMPGLEAAEESAQAAVEGGDQGPAEPDAPEESTNPGTDPRGSKKVEDTLKGSEGAELLNDIPLQIAVELARVPATAEEVVGLKVGQVLDLNRVPGEPIELSVNGKVVARGEIVEVDGNLGVRVLSLAG